MIKNTHLTRISAIAFLFVLIGILPARADIFPRAAEDCFEKGKIEYDAPKPELVCSPAAPCPVADGNCVGRVWTTPSLKTLEYCDCANRPLVDPRDKNACGIFAAFSSSGAFLDSGCGTSNCDNNQACGVAAVPNQALQTECSCQ